MGCRPWSTLPNTLLLSFCLCWRPSSSEMSLDSPDQQPSTPHSEVSSCASRASLFDFLVSRKLIPISMRNGTLQQKIEKIIGSPRCSLLLPPFSLFVGSIFYVYSCQWKCEASSAKFYCMSRWTALHADLYLLPTSCFACLRQATQ